MARTLSLIVRNLGFTVVVPGLGGAWVPWQILTRRGATRRAGRVGGDPRLRRDGPIQVVRCAQLLGVRQAPGL